MFILFRKANNKLFRIIDRIINSINRRLYRRWQQYRRYYFCNRKFNEQKKSNSTPISRTQWKEIRSYWINELKLNSLEWRFEFYCMGGE